MLFSALRLAAAAVCFALAGGIGAVMFLIPALKDGDYSFLTSNGVPVMEACMVAIVIMMCLLLATREFLSGSGSKKSAA